MHYANPQLLVETHWLAEHLSDPEVRVLDCTVYLRPVDGGGVRLVSGQADWAASHIPGSGYADLLQDLSDRNTALPVMLPPAAQFAEAFSRYGVGPDSRVILYDTGEMAWAARVWCMLRAFGFDNAALLNGGMKRWLAEQRPVTSEQTVTRPATFIAKPRPQYFKSKDEVVAALHTPELCLVNALSPAEFRGEVCRVARPGHIPGSVNVPASALLDPLTNCFRTAAELQQLFASAGALGSSAVITYCGGGIAASAVTFALALMGQDAVGIYDGSLVEWSADPALPLTLGPA